MFWVVWEFWLVWTAILQAGNVSSLFIKRLEGERKFTISGLGLGVEFLKCDKRTLRLLQSPNPNSTCSKI